MIYRWNLLIFNYFSFRSTRLFIEVYFNLRQIILSSKPKTWLILFPVFFDVTYGTSASPISYEFSNIHKLQMIRIYWKCVCIRCIFKIFEYLSNFRFSTKEDVIEFLERRNRLCFVLISSCWLFKLCIVVKFNIIYLGHRILPRNFR